MKHSKSYLHTTSEQEVTKVLRKTLCVYDGAYLKFREEQSSQQDQGSDCAPVLSTGGYTS